MKKNRLLQGVRPLRARQHHSGKRTVISRRSLMWLLMGVFVILLVGMLGATAVQAHNVQGVAISSIQHLLLPTATDTDGDGIEDPTDLDDDNDGIPDDVEGCIDEEPNAFGYIEGLVETSYHGGIVKTTDGYSVWGGSSHPDGKTDLAEFVPITATDGYTYTYSGTIKDITLASTGDSEGDQYFILTTEGLYTWGRWSKNYKNTTLHKDMYDDALTDKTTGSPRAAQFQEISLPPGLQASDVKSIEATSERLALLTNNGEVWVAGSSQSFIPPDDAESPHEFDQGEIYADGQTEDDDGDTYPAKWHLVHLPNDPNNPTGPGTVLTNIEQIKLAPGNAMAVDSDGNFWTWGVGVNLGTGGNSENKRYPTQMTMPAGVDVVQFEITARNYSYSDDDGHADPSEDPSPIINRIAAYFVLGSDGKVYVLGQNVEEILGLNKTDVTYYQSSWTPIQKDDGNGGTTDMTDVRFISISNHSAYTLSGALITADGTLYEWGSNDEAKVGQPTSVDFVPVPKVPQGFSNPPAYVDAGGHIIPYFDKDGNFYNVGHRCEGAFADNNTGCNSPIDHYTQSGTSTDTVISQLDEIDLDGDGCPNCRDLDSDNDGISDLIESGLDFATIDTDNDGKVDSTTDGDGDGLMEPVDADDANANADPAGVITSDNIADTDSDSIPNFKDLDSDGDGIPDAVEAQPTDGYQGNDGDVSDDVNNCVPPYEVDTPQDTDNDGTPDYIDTDSDNDGASDADESGLSPGSDNDGDGIGDDVHASYQDPDGDVNTPKDDLTNDEGDANEADYREVTDKVAIGNRVWNDDDEDGQFDAGESGIENVTVQLYRDDGDGVFDPAHDTPVDSATTDSEGRYQFTDVTPSTDGQADTYYFVVIKKTDIPSDYTASSNGGGGTHDPDGADNDDDGYPGPDSANSDYVITNPIKAVKGGQTTADSEDAPAYPDSSSYYTIDFGFHDNPSNAVSLKSVDSSANNNAIVWGLSLLALGMLAIASFAWWRRQNI